MLKYSEKAGEKVEKNMHEMKEGKLKSGSDKKSDFQKAGNCYRIIRSRKRRSKGTQERLGGKRCMV